MAILGRLGAWLVQLLVPIFVKEFSDNIKKWLAERQARKEAEAEAKRSVQPIKDAKTGKEIDDAADSAADGI